MPPPTSIGGGIAAAAVLLVVVLVVAVVVVLRERRSVLAVELNGRENVGVWTTPSTRVCAHPGSATTETLVYKEMIDIPGSSIPNVV